MILDVARESLDAIRDGVDPTPRQQAELAQLLLRDAKSQLAISGVGFGNVEEAFLSLEEAKQVLEGIDPSSTSAELIGVVEKMKLDRLKYLAEVARTRASLATDVPMQKKYLQQAAAIYKERDAAGKKYYDATSNLKGLDVQKSSMQGFGNMLFDLEDLQGAEEAYLEALVHGELLLKLEPSNATRRQRGVAITLYSLAKITNIRDSKIALEQLNRAINISRSVFSLESKNVRRPRDLALMLALRGEILVKQGTDVESGIADCKEAALLLTRRAVESPRELASQLDLEENIIQIADTLELAEQKEVSNEILISTIDQLQCIAGAEELAGRTDWSEILNRLQHRSDAIASASM